MAKFCTNCGKHFGDKATFCDKCGTELKPLDKDSGNPLSDALNTAGETFSDVADSAKNKLNDTLSEENKEKARAALENVQEQFAATDPKKRLFAIISVLLVLIGIFFWRNQPEQQIVRTVERDYEIIADIMCDKFPDEWTSDDINKISDLFTQNNKIGVHHSFAQLRKKMINIINFYPKEVYTRKKEVYFREMKQVKEEITNVHVKILSLHNDSAQVDIMSKTGKTLEENVTLQKENGAWKLHFNFYPLEFR